MISNSLKWVLIFILFPSWSTSFKLQSGVQNNEEESACKGYEELCPKLDPSKNVHVHIVPHSHDDMGWLKNIDEYYYGMKSTVQRAGVQYILDSVIKELYWDPNKK